MAGISFSNPLDPQSQADQQEYEQRLAIAQMLQKQAMTPIQAEQGLRQTPKISPWQGLAQLGQALIAGKDRQDAQKFGQEKNAAVAQRLMGMFQDAPQPSSPDARAELAAQQPNPMNVNKLPSEFMAAYMQANPDKAMQYIAEQRAKQQEPPKLTEVKLGDRTIMIDPRASEIASFAMGASPDHATESGNNLANRTGLSAEQLLQAKIKMKELQDMGVDTAGISLPGQPTSQANLPPPSPAMIAADNAGQPFVATQAPGQEAQFQPVPGQLSPHDQRAANLKAAEAKVPTQKPPTDMRYNADGGIEVIPGTKLDMKQKTAKMTDMQAVQAADRTTGDILKTIDELIGSADGKVKEHPGLQGSVGYLDQKLPPFNKDQANARATINNLGNKLSVQGLQTLRSTGTAPGSITEREWPILQSYLANIDPSQGYEQYVSHLKDLRTGLSEFQNNAHRNYSQKYDAEASGSNAAPPPSGAPQPGLTPAEQQELAALRQRFGKGG